MTFQMYQSGTEWRWRLRANNNKIVADSGEGYQNKADCRNQINNIKMSAASAPIVEV